MILPDYDHRSPCPNCEDIEEARRVAAAKMAAVRARGPQAKPQWDAASTAIMWVLVGLGVVVAAVLWAMGKS